MAKGYHNTYFGITAKLSSIKAVPMGAHITRRAGHLSTNLLLGTKVPVVFKDISFNMPL